MTNKWDEWTAKMDAAHARRSAAPEKECPCCHGNGMLSYPDFDGWGPGMRDCPTCNGKGIIDRWFHMHFEAAEKYVRSLTVTQLGVFMHHGCAAVEAAFPVAPPRQEAVLDAASSEIEGKVSGES